MEKTKFIQKGDLADVIETLFSEAAEHHRDIYLNVGTRDCCGRLHIIVDVRATENYRQLVEEEYEVIDDVNESYDVERDTIDAALAKIQEKEQESIKEA